jgi:hypothetical protein
MWGLSLHHREVVVPRDHGRGELARAAQAAEEAAGRVRFDVLCVSG